MTPYARAALVLAWAASATACEDLRRFAGTWAGPLTSDPAHQEGFAPGSRMTATITTVNRSTLAMSVALPNQPAVTPFELVQRSQDDALGDLRLDGDPLRTYLGFLRPPVVDPYLAVVSLFAENRIDVRVIRGPDETYAIFRLVPAP